MIFKTKGEHMLQRELRQEMRVGIPHYVVGQHKAVIVEDDTHLIAVLSFVNPLGVAIRMMVRRKPGDFWEVCSAAMRAGMEVDWGAAPVPIGFEFSAAMLDVLNKAEIEWMERFTDDG